jgi:hypothetical protein
MRIGQQEDIVVWEEAGPYPAVVLDVVETVSSEQYGSKPRLRIVFRVISGDDYIDVWHFTGATLSKHPNATFRPLVAVLRPDLDLDDPDLELNIGHPEGQRAAADDTLIGAKCRVILGVNAEKGRNVIEKVMPPEAKRSVPRTPVAAGEAAAKPF